MSRRPREVFATVMSLIAEGRWDDVADCYGDDVVVTNPFEADGPTVSVGRRSVQRFYGWLSGQVATLRANDVVVHETTDPEVRLLSSAVRRPQGRVAGHSGPRRQGPWMA